MHSHAGAMGTRKTVIFDLCITMRAPAWVTCTGSSCPEPFGCAQESLVEGGFRAVFPKLELGKERDLGWPFLA